MPINNRLRGSRNPTSKLTEENVADIKRALREEGTSKFPGKVSRTNMAKVMGISRSTLYSIIRGETWRHVS